MCKTLAMLDKIGKRYQIEMRVLPSTVSEMTGFQTYPQFILQKAENGTETARV
jgi:hypothetical protein